MRARVVLVLVSMLWLLAACAPQPAAKDAPPANFPTNPLDRPVQPRPIGQPVGETPSNPNRSCKTDSDCVVNDVGNCCGYYPMCVNKDARTDPKAVQAQCAKSGMASVCGFPEISSCSCVKGQCAADSRASAL